MREEKKEAHEKKPMEIGNVGKTQSRHKSWDIDSTANFPRSLSPTYRRFIL